MDEFVGLTERYGLKPRGKSAPMAALKRSGFNPNTVKASPFDSGDDSNAELTLNDSKFDLLNPGGFDEFLVFDELIKLSTNGSDDGLTGLGPKEDALDSLFIPEPRSSSLPTYSWGSPVAQAQLLDDFSPLFGEFVELPGESDKTRLARWEREQIIKNRMAKVIDDMNNGDRQIQIEQEERSMISETLDAEIKLWATGKEGNLRALLSSLHLVLWPGCGWEAVSLTDLITSAAVKKVYRKANLYVHPDKVQQKGAQQKYIAEKVFSILQEAWNKFKKEELS